MSESTKLCMCCMSEVPAGSRECPVCGYNGTQQNPHTCLAIGSRIAGRYIVGGVLDSDGDSVLYSAYDMSCAQKVCVQEFLPAYGCQRSADGLTLLPKEGAEQHFKASLGEFSAIFFALSLIDDEPGLIKVLDFFEANGTAYAVLERFEGVSLKSFLKMGRGAMRYDQCEKVFAPVFAAVSRLHSRGIVHGGISPFTVFINRNGDVKLGGYATPSVRTRGSEVNAKIFGGYAAPEQYSKNLAKTAATDVYGLAATIYRCLCGISPQEADHRRSYDTLQPAVEHDPTIPLHASRALELAMLLNDSERTQTADELYKQLFEPAGQPEPELEDEDDQELLEEEPQQELPLKDRLSTEFIARVVMFVAIGFFCISLVAFAINALLPGHVQDPVGEQLEIVTVPDFVGKTIDGDAFLDSDFVFELVYEYQEGAEANEVVRQYPLAGSEYKDGTTITLYVNRVKLVTMVDLLGLDMDEAVEKLKEAGIFNYRLQQQDDANNPPDTVIDQSVASGVRFDVYSETVIVTIACEPSDDQQSGNG